MARFGRPGPIALVALVVLSVGAILLGRLASGPHRPNIVLIVWDTVRGDRVSVNGYPHPTTPRLEELAADGVTFRWCFTPAPWTPPAHASLFTGLLPRSHGLREGMGDRIRTGIPLLAQTLQEAGYETVSVPANPLLSDVTGLNAGFEFDFPCFRNPRVDCDAVRDQVRRWADRRRATRKDVRPVFLFVNLMESHLPYAFDAASVAAVHGVAAVEGARRAAGEVGDMEAKAFLLGQRKIDRESIRDLGIAYDGAIRRDDRVTGEILEILREEGFLGGAFVAVCSDHGENLGEHGELNHAMSVYGPVLRVPLVVRWPGKLEGGTVVDAQVRLQDLYPTILEAAGIAVPAPCGTDAVTLLEKPLRPRTAIAGFGPMLLSLPEARAAMPDAPPGVFDRFHFLYRAVQEPSEFPGARKYIGVYRDEKGEEPVLVREELYDISADPGEMRDLLAPGGAPTERAAADRLRGVGAAGK
jgi:arylsulfatase A-like enzyme